MATSIVQILCWQKSRRKERKKHEKHSTSCWHTYQALNRHLKVCYSCWQMSLHTHAHTHGYTLAPKSPQSASSSTACWPIKVARHLSSLSFFSVSFFGTSPTPQKKTLTRIVDQPQSLFFLFFFLSFTIRNVVHGFVFQLGPICFSLSWSDKCNFRQSLLPCD